MNQKRSRWWERKLRHQVVHDWKWRVIADYEVTREFREPDDRAAALATTLSHKEKRMWKIETY